MSRILNSLETFLIVASYIAFMVFACFEFGWWSALSYHPTEEWVTLSMMLVLFALTYATSAFKERRQ
jgi:hypothetical protein